MKCPVCGTVGAYVGFSSVECPNRLCEHFSVQVEKYMCPCCGRSDHPRSAEGGAGCFPDLLGVPGAVLPSVVSEEPS